MFNNVEQCFTYHSVDGRNGQKRFKYFYLKSDTYLYNQQGFRQMVLLNNMKEALLVKVGAQMRVEVY